MMKVLWITNRAIGDARTELLRDNRPFSSGGWLQPFLDYLKMCEDVEIVIVTSDANKKVRYLKCDNVTYYILPGGNPIPHYNGYARKNIDQWEKLLDREKPDIIHIWGCESSLGAAALAASDKNIPSVIYIQGLCEAIDRYCEAGISRDTQKRIATLRDYIRQDTVWMQHKQYQKKTMNEKWIISHCNNIIVENQWCRLHCEKMADNINTYYLPLSINPLFFIEQREKDYERHIIMCPLSYGPIKGLHILLKAMGLLRKKYPDVKLRLPGSMHKAQGLIGQLRESGYHRYLKQMITNEGLVGSVDFLGILSTEEMVHYMKNSHVFVMCSAIENHSASLKEAMALGVPCVASDVGGISEYAKHRENVLLYRYEEYELLAGYIAEYFENDELSDNISTRAREQMALSGQSDKTVAPIIDIYKTIIKEHKNNE